MQTMFSAPQVKALEQGEVCEACGNNQAAVGYYLEAIGPSPDAASIPTGRSALFENLVDRWFAPPAPPPVQRRMSPPSP